MRIFQFRIYILRKKIYTCLSKFNILEEDSLNKPNLNIIKTISISLLSVIVAGCLGGGGGAGTNLASAASAGLNAPSNVGIVNESNSSSSSLNASSSSSAGISSAFNATSTDYSKQIVDSWVKTNSGSEMLAEINYLLCITGLANTADYPNATYRAKHNAKLCRRASGSYPLYGKGPVDRTMIVTTSRASATAPFKQTMWVSVPYGYDGKNFEWPIVFDIEVTKEPSSSQPLGEFTLTYQQFNALAPTTTSWNGLIKAYSENDKNYVSAVFKMARSDQSDSREHFDTYSSMIIELDGSGALVGMAKIDQPKWTSDFAADIVRSVSKVNFNADYINEQKAGETAVCSSQTNKKSNVWDYKMFYKDTGAVLNMNGGFPVKYTLNGVSGKRGWADKWGLWTDAEADNPTVITQDDSIGAVFDVVRAGGKLRKRTKGTRSLATNENLVYWYQDTEKEYKVQWTGSTFISKDTVTGYAAALAHLNEANTSGKDRWPYSGRLNQQVKYTGSSTVIYWADEDVKPWNSVLSGGNLSLTCYGLCPQGQVSRTLADLDHWDETAVNNQEAGAFSTSGKAYTFDSTNMLLKYSGTAVVLDPSVSSSVESRFDMRLVPQGSSVTNWWETDEQSVHYIWESGSKDWHKSINFKKRSTSAFYQFSDPVKFDYTHLTANDLNSDSTYNNISYYLEYDGGLHGIPSIKVDDNWIREISLKDGDIFNSKAKLLGRELVLKAVGIEKNPVSASGSCTALPLGSVSLNTPNHSITITTSKTWADRLNITVPAGYKVIDGVAQ